MFHRLSLAVLAACALPFAAMAQDQAASFRAQEAQVFRGTGGAPLTFPSQAAAPAIIADFLRGEGYADATVDSLSVESEHTVERTGLTHLRFEQRVAGLTVFGAYAKAAVNEAGELVHLIAAVAPADEGRLLPSNIDPREALDAALAETHPDVDVTLQPGGGAGNTVAFTGDDFFYRDPTVTRVAIAMQSGILQEGFLVETWSEEENLLHHTLVGGNGRVLGVELRTNNDQYNIFQDHPGNSDQTVVSGPGTINTESPIGWLFIGDHTTINIAGNNVNAYLDRDNNNGPDDGGYPVKVSDLDTDGNFLAAADLNADPTLDVNQDVAVQNLFYFNNVIHDKLRQHGFTEAFGNFQESNFIDGGLVGDPVLAEAQDGGGTNNANFATPNDGSKPRMQMYIWTQSTPNRDGDLDSDIIYHEYCHGLTWRMIGSMSGPMSGAIGEGMSDACAILINDNDVVGEYSFDDPLGIRSESYTDYSRTYGDFTGDSVHFDGEIYAAIIWYLWSNHGAAIGEDTLWDYLVGGMNHTPEGPAFEHMRDGILAAVGTDGHHCLVWESFAKFGVGDGAGSVEERKGPIVIKGYTITESFAVPSECPDSGTVDNPPSVNVTNPTDGSKVSGTVIVTAGATDDNGGTQVEFFVDENSSIGVDSNGSDGWAAQWDTTIYAGGSHTVKAVATDSAAQTASDSVSVTVDNSTSGDAPSVTGVTPTSMQAGSSVDVTISATGFVAGASVSFENGSGPAPSATNVVIVDVDTISATFTAPSGGPRRNRVWDVRVTNPDSSNAVLFEGFTVNP